MTLFFQQPQRKFFDFCLFCLWFSFVFVFVYFFFGFCFFLFYVFLFCVVFMCFCFVLFLCVFVLCCFYVFLFCVVFMCFCFVLFFVFIRNVVCVSVLSLRFSLTVFYSAFWTVRHILFRLSIVYEINMAGVS